MTENSVSSGSSHVCLEAANRWLPLALNLSEGDRPFPWQEELLVRFADAKIERSLDIPTGLGKTAVMAIWLVARALGAALPRRLVYVVDRRAVVDQATDVARQLRACVDANQELKLALGLGSRSLPISTLRGQYVDNKEWLEDPASPAIVVGTVDMVGSRLLFEGYGTSRKMRPYLAGLLGADTLVVLDEAHLVPPFEKLLEAIADGGALFGARTEEKRNLVPSFRLLSLSATGRSSGRKAFGLQHADLVAGSIVRKRLDAPKRLFLLPPLEDQKLHERMAAQAWKLTENGTLAVRVIVFCDSRKVAKDVKTTIDELAMGDRKLAIPEVKVDTELFVGGRRVFEREATATWLRERGFMAGAKTPRTCAAFVVATSAGEVGVDLDADHMVSDLVAWERTVQRLGRVNRRGEGEAQVMVLTEATSKEVEKARGKARDDRNARETAAILDADTKDAARQLFEHLPLKDGARDASPGAFRALKASTHSDLELQKLLERATTVAPLRPALSRALVDAWSMTSLKVHTGRPEVDPWLRGWIEDEPPRTAVVWRRHMPVRPGDRAAGDEEIEAFFEAAAPHASEVLETETFRVVEWLAARAKKLLSRVAADHDRRADSEQEVHTAPLSYSDVAAIVLAPTGDLRAILALKDLALPEETQARKDREKKLRESLVGATLVVDIRICGLDGGLLDDAGERVPRTVDDGVPWMVEASADTAGNALCEDPVVRFRVRITEQAQVRQQHAQWRERYRFATYQPEDREPTRWLVVEKWRYDAATEEDRSAGRPQLLSEHQSCAENKARELARRLGLPGEYSDMLATAARLHDEGKQSKRWQKAFNARGDGLYAKTRGPVNTALLDGYRHEFGSLPFAARDERLSEFSTELQDLALHLIAAHHGFARPVISTAGCEDAPPSALEGRAHEVALRFARLQKLWGPWGLAWWEALLRAADQQASRDNDEKDSGMAQGDLR